MSWLHTISNVMLLLRADLLASKRKIYLPQMQLAPGCIGDLHYSRFTLPGRASQIRRLKPLKPFKF